MNALLSEPQHANKPKLLGAVDTDIIGRNHISGIYPRCRDQVRQAIRTRHYSIRTEQAYVQWIKRFILFHNKRHPKDMGEQEINHFLTYLATKCNVAASTQNQAWEKDDSRIPANKMIRLKVS